MTSFQQAQAVQARQVQSLVTALLPIGEPELTMFCHLDMDSMYMMQALFGQLKQVTCID
tara:strand:- start:338 stop:514 length:177 start_codon:yes stop_codon:yes gene_type:complete